MSLVISPFALTGRSRLIASASNINGNSLAVNALTMANGVLLANYAPTFFVVWRITGTFSLAVVRLVQGAFNLSALTSLSDLGASGVVRVIAPITGPAPFDNTAGLSISVTTINGTAATFNIDVFGVQYA
jgi:hypothetical protein